MKSGKGKSGVGFPVSNTEDGVLSVALTLLIILTPTVFYRSIHYTFYLPQLTVFWILGLFIFLIFIYKVLISRDVYKLPILLFATVLFFVLSLILVSIFSEQTWQSFTGLDARGAGAFSYLLCVIIFLTIFQLGQKKPLAFLSNALICTHIIVATYTVLQKFGLDPIEWGSEVQLVGNLIFSTLGNSNFSAGYLVSTLPLLAWAAFSTSFSKVFRTVLGFSLGISSLALVYLDTAQGDVAALLTFIPLANWVFSRHANRLLIAILTVLPAVLTCCFLPLLSSDIELRFPLFVVLITGVSAYFSDFLDRNNEKADFSKIFNKKVFFNRCLGTLFLIVTVAVFLFWERINDGLKSGLDQRLEYWKSGYGVFSENLFFGTGLETFGSHFTAHRSLEHAVQWPTVLTDSTHSVPIGLLSNGGIVLTFAYLLIQCAIAFFAFKAIKKADSSTSYYLGVSVAWLCYHLQTLVSIDTTGLIYIQWVLAGILVHGGVSNPVRSTSLKIFRSLGSEKSLKSKKLVLGTVLLLVFLFSMGPLTAPIRANAAAFKGESFYIQRDYEQAEEYISKAVDLQPRAPIYATSLAVIHEVIAQPEVAFLEFERAARLSPGLTSPSIQAAHSAIRIGKIDRAQHWYENALAHDPFNPNVILEVVGFYASNSRKQASLDLLAAFEELESPWPSHWSYAAKVYDYFGESSRTKHAQLCSVEEQRGCGFLQAIIFEDQGNLSEAVNELKFIVEKNPENLFAYLEIGRILGNMGNNESARIWYLEAVDLDQYDVQVLTKSAEFFVSIGDLKTAYELLDKFESVKSQNTSHWSPIMKIYEKIGDKERYNRAYLCASGNPFDLDNYQKGCWE